VSRYFVSIDGKEREVTGFSESVMVIDGNEVRFDLRRVSEHVYSVMIDGRSVTVVIGDDLDGQRASVNGKQVHIVVESLRARLIRELDKSGGAGKGSLEIRAPMPALVGSVLVAPGDTVQKGQGLIILEAMKMENEIKAHSGGIVKEISVEKGSAVEKNELLITFEPPEEQG